MNALKNLKTRFAAFLDQLPARTRQWATVAGISVAAVGVMWVALSAGTDTSKKRIATGPAPGELTPTNIDLMAPGAQVSDKEVWVGQAGRKLAQYENDRDEQRRINRERKEAEDALQRRFAELELRLKAPVPEVSTPAPVPAIAAPPMPTPAPPVSPATPRSFPPSSALGGLPPQPGSRTLAMPSGVPSNGSVPGSDQLASPAVPALVRVSLAPRSKPTEATANTSSKTPVQNIDNFLPVSFTRGVLLGGLDAPTGGQSQGNPYPVLIRLSDNSVLPNRFRGEYRECFVVAAGYGDISAERAYLRTETLSCVRGDGSAMEIKIQGSVYGEDGKYGMRGRLVSKQGQMLANALMAGVVSGIGHGIATNGTSLSTSALGQISTTSGSDNLKAGLGSGIGNALDRLAQYYIKLAEQTFPVIEIDAGREIDVVITKGVRIEGADLASTTLSSTAHTGTPDRTDPSQRYLKVTKDEE